MAIVGDAYVKISPELKEFASKLQAGISGPLDAAAAKMVASFARAGQESATSISESFGRAASTITEEFAGAGAASAEALTSEFGGASVAITEELAGASAGITEEFGVAGAASAEALTSEFAGASVAITEELAGATTGIVEEFATAGIESAAAIEEPLTAVAVTVTEAFAVAGREAAAGFSVPIIEGAAEAEVAVAGVGAEAAATGGGFAALATAATGGLDLIAVAALAVTSGLIYLGVSGVKAFREQQEATDRLNKAFELTGKLTQADADYFTAYADKLQKTTRFQDDAIAGATVILSRHNLTRQQLEKLLPLTLDYAAATGRDLASAAGVVGKAIEGQGRALKELGIHFEDTKDPIKNFDELISKLGPKVKGFAERDAQTLNGQMEIMKNRFNDAKESIGQSLAPALEGLGKLVVGIVLPAFVKFAQFLADIIGGVYEKILPSFHELGAAFTRLGAAFGDLFGTSLKGAKTGIIDFVSNGIIFFVHGLTRLVDFITDHVIPAIKRGVTAVGEWLNSMLEGGPTVDRFGEKVTSSTDKASEGFAKLRDQIKVWWKDFVDGLDLPGLKKAFVDVFGVIYDAVKEIFINIGLDPGAKTAADLLGGKQAKDGHPIYEKTGSIFKTIGQVLHELILTFLKWEAVVVLTVVGIIVPILVENFPTIVDIFKNIGLAVINMAEIILLSIKTTAKVLGDLLRGDFIGAFIDAAKGIDETIPKARNAADAFGKAIVDQTIIQRNFSAEELQKYQPLQAAIGDIMKAGSDDAQPNIDLAFGILDGRIAAGSEVVRKSIATGFGTIKQSYIDSGANDTFLTIDGDLPDQGKTFAGKMDDVTVTVHTALGAFGLSLPGSVAPPIAALKETSRLLDLGLAAFFTLFHINLDFLGSAEIKHTQDKLGALRDQFGTSSTGIGNQISNSGDALSGGFGSTGGKVAGAATGFHVRVEGALNEGHRKSKGAVEDGRNKLGDILAGFAEVLRTRFPSFNAIVDRFFFIGEAIVQGIWQGFDALIEELKRHIGESLKKIKGHVEVTMEVQSPSKHSFWVAEMYMQGFINGIQSKRGEMLAAVSDVFGAVGPSVNSVLGGGSISSSGALAYAGSTAGGAAGSLATSNVTNRNVTNNVVVNPQGPLDERALAFAISSRLGLASIR